MRWSARGRPRWGSCRPSLCPQLCPGGPGTPPRARKAGTPHRTPQDDVLPQAQGHKAEPCPLTPEGILSPGLGTACGQCLARTRPASSPAPKQQQQTEPLFCLCLGGFGSGHAQGRRLVLQMPGHPTWWSEAAGWQGQQAQAPSPCLGQRQGGPCLRAPASFAIQQCPLVAAQRSSSPPAIFLVWNLNSFIGGVGPCHCGANRGVCLTSAGSAQVPKPPLQSARLSQRDTAQAGKAAPGSSAGPAGHTADTCGA